MKSIDRARRVPAQTRWRRLAALAGVGALTVAGIVAGSTVASASVDKDQAIPQGQWNPTQNPMLGGKCIPSHYYQSTSVDGGASTALFSGAFSGGEYVLSKVATMPGLRYDALSTDLQNAALYASVTGVADGEPVRDAHGQKITKGDIIYIDRNTGEVTNLGYPTDFPLTGDGQRETFDVGASGAGKIYLTNSSVDDATLYSFSPRFDNTSSVKLKAKVGGDLTTVRMGEDRASKIDYLWGRQDAEHGGQLVRVNPNTGDVDTFPMPHRRDGGPAGGARNGAAFTFSNGNLGLLMSNGRTYQIDLGNPDAPTPKVVAEYDSPAGEGMDGTSCGLDSADLSVGMTSELDSSGATPRVKWQMRVYNNGTTPSSGWRAIFNSEADPRVSGVKTLKAEAGAKVSIDSTSTWAQVDGGAVEPGANQLIEFSTNVPGSGGEKCMRVGVYVQGYERDPDDQNDVNSGGYCAEKAATVAWSNVDDVDGTTPVGGATWNLVGPISSDAAKPRTIPIDDNGPLDADRTAGTFSAAIVEPGAYRLEEATPPKNRVTSGSKPLSFTVSKALDESLTLDPVKNAKQAPKLDLARSTDVPSGSTVTAGTVVTHTVTAKNTGNVDLAEAKFSDAISGGTIVTGSVSASLDDKPIAGSAVGENGSTVTFSGPIPVGKTAVLTYKVVTSLPSAGTSEPKPTAPAEPTTAPTETVTATATATSAPAPSDGPITLPGTGGSKPGKPGLPQPGLPQQTTGPSAEPTADASSGPSSSATATATPTATAAPPSSSAPSTDVPVLEGNGTTSTELVDEITPENGDPFKATCTTGSCDTKVEVVAPKLALKASVKTVDDLVAVYPSQQLTYTVTAKNTSDSPLAGASVSSDLTAVLPYGSVVPDSLKTVTGPEGAPIPQLRDREVVWTGDLAPQAELSYSYSVKVNADVAEDGVLSAVATASGEGVTSNCTVAGSAADNPDCATNNKVGTTDLDVVTKADNDGNALAPGDEVTIVTTARNAAAGALPSVRVSDDLSGVLKHASLVSGSLKANIDGTPTTAPTVDATAQKLTWSGKLAEGDMVSVSYTVKLKKAFGEGDALVNQVSAEAKNAAGTAARADCGPDFLIDDCRVTVSLLSGGLELIRPATQAATKTTPGATLTRGFEAKNTGNQPLASAVVSEDLTEVLAAAALDKSSLAASIDGKPVAAPARSQTGGLLRWEGSIPAGKSVKITYKLTVNKSVDKPVGATTVLAGYGHYLSSDNVEMPAVVNCAAGEGQSDAECLSTVTIAASDGSTTPAPKPTPLPTPTPGTEPGTGPDAGSGTATPTQDPDASETPGEPTGKPDVPTPTATPEPSTGPAESGAPGESGESAGQGGSGTGASGSVDADGNASGKVDGDGETPSASATDRPTAGSGDDSSKAPGRAGESGTTEASDGALDDGDDKVQAAGDDASSPETAPTVAADGTPLVNTGVGTGWLLAGLVALAAICGGGALLLGARRKGSHSA